LIRQPLSGSPYNVGQGETDDDEGDEQPAPLVAIAAMIGSLSATDRAPDPVL
jgi:hypothetical protein